MPFGSKKKKPATDGVRTAGKSIKTTFKRYNSEKVTAEGVKRFFLFNFYKIGYTLELNAAMIGRQLGGFFSRAYESLSNIFHSLALFLDSLADTILDDLGEPLERAGEAAGKISAIIKETKADKQRKTGEEVREYVKQGLSKHKDLTRRLMAYVVPACTALVFIVTVSVGLGRDYAIQVSLDGEKIGVIKDYTTLENADKIIKNKLVSTDEQSWNLNSEIKMVSLSGKETVDERQLANNILSASDENIVEATGLYVDGEFVGAVKDATALRAALESLKQPYENGDPNRTVSFVQDVSVVEGIFFANTVVEDQKLADMVVSEVSGEKHYSVVEGDSPSLIASKNGITTRTLYNLNPGLEGGGLWVGDDLIVGASVPFLQVKYIETSTRQVEIDYQTKTEKNNSMNLGTTKVTQEGEKGINEETVESVYIDGVLQSETVVNTTVIKEPVTEIIQQGTLFNGTVVQGGTGKIIWPVPAGGRLSRGFYGQYPSHNGLDIAAPIGTTLVAADTGVVIKTVYSNVGYGIYCIIDHGGYQTLYGHCSALLVSVGQQVTQGQAIARMGSTGNSTGSHVHFEVKNGEYRYDPMGWF